MSNFGFFDLRLVDPYDAAWQEARSAVGARAVLKRARVFESVEAAVADCTLVVGTASIGNRELHLAVQRLERAGTRIRRAVSRGPVALLFGSEKYGLSNDDLSHCHWLLRIPTRNEHESMNLGQAVALCVYELARRPLAKDPVRRLRPISAGELTRIEQLLNDLLQVSGYVKETMAKSAGLKLRRLLRRTALHHKDAEVWLGIMRQIGWKLRQSTQLGPKRPDG